MCSHDLAPTQRANGAISAQDIKDGATVNMTSGRQRSAAEITGSALVSAKDAWWIKRLHQMEWLERRSVRVSPVRH